jgi:hypothetical protein
LTAGGRKPGRRRSHAEQAVTEAEWLASTDPVAMLEHVREHAGDRKLRLFAVACCRHNWEAITDDGRDAVEVAGQFADGEVTATALREAWSRTAAFSCESLASSGLEPYPLHYWIRRQCENFDLKDAVPILRDLFGHLFSHRAVEPAWLRFNDGLVARLAEGIYADQAFDQLPILGDALEDAGCADRAILDHCRSGGEHYRGCWVVDLLLRKQ